MNKVFQPNSATTIDNLAVADMTSPNAMADHKLKENQAITDIKENTGEMVLKSSNGAYAPNGEGVDDEKVTGGQVTSPDMADDITTKFTEVKPASKNKSRGYTARGEGAMPKFRGTGFEDNYCDPPISPAEYSEEMEYYSPHLPFHERIQECIQRYRARRRMNPDQTEIFTKYLLIGGIDATPRMFTGSGARQNGKDVFGEASKDEIRAMTANDVVQIDSTGSRFYNPNYPEHWDVDFTGVAKGFITSFLPIYTGAKLELINTGIDTISNFLRYVHMHSVCPEFEDDIQKALSWTLAAKAEMPLISAAFMALPGDFNLAARQLLGTGQINDFYIATNHTLTNLNARLEAGLDPERVFKSTVAIWGHFLSDDDFKRALDIEKLQITAIHKYDLEYVGSLFPNADVKASYAGVKDRATGKQCVVEPVGLSTFKHVVIEDGYDRPAGTVKTGEEKFFLEESIVGTEEKPGPLLPGMKIRAVVCELNCGLKYLMDVSEVKPSMYLFLPQELMLHYKEPLDNERPAPSVANPEAEEEQEMEHMLEGGMVDEV